MTEQVDYDSDTEERRDSPVQIKGRGHARFNRGGGGDQKGRGGVFETIDQTGAERGGPAHCE